MVETDRHHGGREPERVVHCGVDKVERFEVALVMEGGRGGGETCVKQQRVIILVVLGRYIGRFIIVNEEKNQRALAR